MNEAEWKKKLSEEGFTDFFVWRDGPGTVYPEHTHAETTTHVVLDGELTLTMDGKTQPLRAGERFDVAANTVHAARMGPHGCRYLVGRRESRVDK